MELIGSESTGDPTADDVVKNFDPDQATFQVWAGEDAELAQYFEDCLRGVGIGSVVGSDGMKVCVLVLRAAEKRAREVIREIVEGMPPK